MKIKLLLIEDDKIDRLAIKRALIESDLNFDLSVAGNLADGLTLLDEMQFDCVLLDQNLPDGTGLERLSSIAGDVDEPVVPVVFLTGFGTEKLAIDALRAGAQDFLNKDSISPDVVYRAIRNAIERHELIQHRIRSDKGRIESDTILRAILNNIADGLVLIDADGIVEGVNPATEKIFGYEQVEMIGQNIKVLMPPDVAAEHGKYLQRYFEGRGQGFPTEVIGRRKDGSDVPLEVVISELAIDGETRLVGAVRDVSDLRKRERSLQQEKEFSSAIFNSTGAMIFVLNRDRKLVNVNSSCEQITGYSGLELSDRPFRRSLLSKIDLVRIDKAMEDVFSGQGDQDLECSIVRKDGENRDIAWRYAPVFDESGQVEFVTCTGSDVTDIRSAEKHYRVLAENISDVVFLCDAQGTIEYVSPSCEETLGFSASELLDMGDIFGLSHPDDNEIWRRAHLRCITRGQPINFTVRLRTKDGGTQWFEMVTRSFSREEGHIEGLVVNARDITARREVEEQLRQTQKMDAVGQLTGGVAHDFNNILQVVIGNLQLLERRCKDQPEVMGTLGRVLGASRRAADLTKRLLAFSRRQVLETQRSNLNGLLEDFESLVRRTLGEQIELKFLLDDGLWDCNSDVSQFEAAVLNLCINARDAMPTGGHLIVETHNVVIDSAFTRQEPDLDMGEYVVMAVSDTGGGIPEDILPKVFEPFFTTKDKDQGTGLGLSMTYGYVKQVGGHLTIYSEVNAGTTVKLYFPRSAVDEKTAVGKGLLVDLANYRGTEKILVVEDDDDVREIIVMMLGDHGFKIRQAGDGETAIKEARSNPDFDLLLTDVVLPHGLRGPTIADQIRKEHPDLKVLFMSGYADQAFNEERPLLENEFFISKPVTEEELLAGVARALNKDAA